MKTKEIKENIIGLENGIALHQAHIQANRQEIIRLKKLLSPKKLIKKVIDENFELDNYRNNQIWKL